MPAIDNAHRGQLNTVKRDGRLIKKKMRGYKRDGINATTVAQLRAIVAELITMIVVLIRED